MKPFESSKLLWTEKMRLKFKQGGEMVLVPHHFPGEKSRKVPKISIGVKQFLSSYEYQYKTEGGEFPAQTAFVGIISYVFS